MKPKVVVGKAENITQTRQMFVAELPIIELATGNRIFKLTIETFNGYPDSWLCWPPISTFGAKKRFRNDAEFIEAIEFILSECLVEWDKEHQEELKLEDISNRG